MEDSKENYDLCKSCNHPKSDHEKVILEKKYEGDCDKIVYCCMVDHCECVAEDF